MNQIIIGLEAHDGSGKSTTAKEIAALFKGQVFFTKDEMKESRKPVYSSEMNQKEKMEKIGKRTSKSRSIVQKRQKTHPLSFLTGHGYLIQLKRTSETNLMITLSHFMQTEPFQMVSRSLT